MSVQPWGVEPAQQAALAQAVEWHVRVGWRVESSPMPGQVVVGCAASGPTTSCTCCCPW
jgi:hypothetical protein